VQRLVNIAYIVDNQPQRKRPCVSLVGEVALDLGVIGAGLVGGAFAGEPVRQVLERIQDLYGVLDEVKVGEAATLV
jgi:hypothetical protein